MPGRKHWCPAPAIRARSQVVNGAAIIRNAVAKPALIGAAITALCGLLIWGTPLGDAWVNASYDYLYRFGSRNITNQVVLVLMDNASCERLGQKRDSWDRALHARMLKKLTADHCALAVFDILFKSERDPGNDRALAEAIRQLGHVVLTANVTRTEVTDPGRAVIESDNVIEPLGIFRAAAANCGVGHADPQTGAIARRHWPFFAPGEGKFHSLGWAAAETFGAQLDPAADQQWLRYYSENGAGELLSYYLALDKTPGYFSNKVVFIGGWPNDSDPGAPEDDKFLTPYSHWNGRAVGGVSIMATTFLNLVNGDWLRRSPPWSEAAILMLAGILIGGGLCALKPLPAGLVAAGISLTVTLAFVSWSYFSNHWFPWLVIAGGQVPCALACSWACHRRPVTVSVERFPGYTIVGEPFGEGTYGKVRRVRDTTGQLLALKEIERSKFDDDEPYEREFRGIKSYKPVSNQHPGLLHIDHVNRNDREGYFYYVMELGDALDPDWEGKSEPYRPRDLASVCRGAAAGRLTAGECVRIGLVLLEALDFLHRNGLVHRDIKPSNIIFVNGRPKLADVGLVREASQDATWVGTEGYMPPEGPGKPPADVFSMGKLLYVISTGKHPRSFAELSTTLVGIPEFMRLNEIICKACQPAADQRYLDAGEMLMALKQAQRELEGGSTLVI